MMRPIDSRVAQAHQLPGVTRVGGLVDAVPPRGALAIVVLARSDPDRVCVVGRNGDIADRDDVIDVVEEHFPRGAVVGGSPQAAGGGADVEHRRVRLEHRQVVDASAHHRGTDISEGQPGVEVGCRRGEPSPGALVPVHRPPPWRQAGQSRARATSPRGPVVYASILLRAGAMYYTDRRKLHMGSSCRTPSQPVKIASCIARGAQASAPFLPRSCCRRWRPASRHRATPSTPSCRRVPANRGRPTRCAAD